MKLATSNMLDARKEKVYTEIYTELEELAMKDENLIDAFGTWEELSQTPETRFAYEMRLKAIIDDEARLSDAIDKGEERGIQKVAQQMLAANVDIETIQKFTGLSIETLQQLQQDGATS